MALSVAVAVGDKVGDELVKDERCNESSKCCPYDDEENDFGPLIQKNNKEKVVFIDSAENQGASIVDGRQIKVSGYENGFFVGGTLIDNVNAEMDYIKKKYLALYYK